MATSSITSRLLRWYRKHGRDLPWRRTRDPYKILVSEVMLQQTQVSRVIDFYNRWLKQFPTWEGLAHASNAQVIRAWSGLGYNRRALVLRDIAKHVVTGGLPKREGEWLKVKGIGPYTAAAVSVFSARQRTFPIDTNTRRVVGRVFLQQLFPDPKRDEEIQRVAMEQLMTSRSFDDVVQALFDLANTHCTKVPDCETCPLRDVCASSKLFLSGGVNTPKQMTNTANEKRHRNKPHPDRMYRGRILKIVQSSKKSIQIHSIGAIIDKSFNHHLDQHWLLAMLKRLEKDGMVVVRNGRISLAQ